MALFWKPVQLTNPMVEPFSVGSQIESSGIMLSDPYTWGQGVEWLTESAVKISEIFLKLTDTAEIQ